MALLSGGFNYDKARSLKVMIDSRQYSIIQLLAEKAEVSDSGAYVQIFDTQVTGNWVGTVSAEFDPGVVGQVEGGRKSVREQAVTSTTMGLYEWATIIPISNRVIRANPNGILDLIKNGAYAALNRDFDALAFGGVIGLGTSVADSMAAVTNTTDLQVGSVVGPDAGVTGDNKGTWTGLNNGLKLLADTDKDWGASIWDKRTEVIFNTDVDGNNRPLYVDVLPGSRVGDRPGNVLGRPSDFAKKVNPKVGALAAADVVGYAGDWSRAIWGVDGPIRYDVSTEASFVQGGVTVSAFQNNLTLFRIESRVGFKLIDPAAFVKFTLGNPEG